MLTRISNFKNEKILKTEEMRADTATAVFQKN